MSLPLSGIARDLKAAFPGCKITVFISGAASGISAIFQGFDEEIILPVTSPVAAQRVLDRHRCDVLIEAMQWPRMTAIQTALAPGCFTIGFKTAHQHRHYAYDVAVPHSAAVHEVENYRRLLIPLSVRGGRLPCARPEIRRGTGSATKEIILHPWASGYRSAMREWPIDNWIVVAQELIADGYTLAVTGGPSDRDRANTFRSLIARPDAVAVLAGVAGLFETAQKLANAALIISVNTGTMHLAAAVGEKLIALHGPTSPARWGPLTEQAVIIGPDAHQGGAYLNLGFEYPRNVPDCMVLIKTSDVIGQARRLLDAGNFQV